jgi:hypothetical protein
MTEQRARVRRRRVSVPVVPLQEDGTGCRRAMTPGGKPRDPVAGRARYRAVCCAPGRGWTKTAELRGVVDDAGRRRRLTHTTEEGRDR